MAAVTSHAPEQAILSVLLRSVGTRIVYEQRPVGKYGSVGESPLRGHLRPARSPRTDRPRHGAHVTPSPRGELPWERRTCMTPFGSGGSLSRVGRDRAARPEMARSPRSGLREISDNCLM